MPKPKNLTCKNCESSFVPETDMQKLVKICNICLKEIKKGDFLIINESKIEEAKEEWY